MRLELKDITKRFPGVLANDRISISVDKGEVLGLLGENGAGKTTLMNILSGLYRPDSGEIIIDGDDAHVRRSAPGDRCRHRHGPPALPARARLRRRRIGRARCRERQRTPRDVRPRRRPPARRRALQAIRPQRQPRRDHRRPPRRRPPAGRDPQGALSQERHPRPRRAVGGPHPVRDGRALRHHPGPGGDRDLDHLHHPQARRGAGGRGPDHGPAPRRRGRHGGPEDHHRASTSPSSWSGATWTWSSTRTRRRRARWS